MNVFDLRTRLVGSYERFARSFTTIRAADIRNQVEAVQSWTSCSLSVSALTATISALSSIPQNGSTIPTTLRRLFAS
jgi:hypothetical protein